MSLLRRSFSERTPLRWEHGARSERCALANHARSAGNLRRRRLCSAERGIDTEGYSGLPREIEHFEVRTR
jgi:LSD1 subclass zinc finger protein